MDKTDRPRLGFAQTRLPWVAAGAALLLYLVTVSPWVRLDSLTVVAKITGWDWTPMLAGSVHYLITLPFRWLPTSVQPLLLNVLSAVMGAVTVALLVRCVALLPHDRTRESRMRERSEWGLLSIPLAWVGPAVGAVLLGLQLTFWEHATAATGEMLDLLLFAYVVRCLLEYRVGERESWLLRAALVYGLGVTNNYAMVAFFPCFFLVVFLLKGLGFFNLAFLGRMALGGVAGLLPYLVLPLAAVLTDGSDEVGFWGYLRAVLGGQKVALTSFPPYVILLVALTSLVPALMLGIRWPESEGDTSQAGVWLAAFITRVMHVVLLGATMSVFFDPVWSARRLGFGFALLPFYFLAALAAGYYTGYVLLVFRELKRPHRRVGTGERLLNRVVPVLGVVGVVVVAGVLAGRNLPRIRQSDGRQLQELTRLCLEALPASGAYVLSDQRADVLLLEAALARQKEPDKHVLVATRLMPFRRYHEELGKRYGSRWPYQEVAAAGETVETGLLATLVHELARSNHVYYLHPSMGYYFELCELQQQGLVFQVVPRGTNSLVALPTTPERIAANEQYWEGLLPRLERLPVATPEVPVEVRYVNQALTRALNAWAVTLQRAGQLEPARRWFELILRLRPDNTSARLSLAFNEELRSGKVQPLEAAVAVGLERERRDLDQLLLQDGPFDQPQKTFLLGQAYVRNGFFRQALDQFQRVREVMPEEPRVGMWTGTMEVMARMGLGEVAAAEAQALELQQQYPQQDIVLEVLTQLYLSTGRYTNALASIDEQLRLDAKNARALLNQAAILIHLKEYTQALAPLDALLKQQPDNQAALMNRAIAYLQGGQLDQAQQDYEALQKLVPEYHAVYYGLGEIAMRKQDAAAALRHYEAYLKYGDRASEEYQAVAAKVQKLKGGAP
jgi:tetratricopeptide (TPR) repeat protein